MNPRGKDQGDRFIQNTINKRWETPEGPSAVVLTKASTDDSEIGSDFNSLDNKILPKSGQIKAIPLCQNFNFRSNALFSFAKTSQQRVLALLSSAIQQNTLKSSDWIKIQGNQVSSELYMEAYVITTWMSVIKNKITCEKGEELVISTAACKVSSTYPLWVIFAEKWKFQRVHSLENAISSKTVPKKAHLVQQVFFLLGLQLPTELYSVL